MSEQVCISVDAMGGDHAPNAVLDGVKQALAADSGLRIVLCGPEEIVVPFCEQVDRCEPRSTTEVIAMDEHPANAVRQKKDSSIVVGCRLVKEGTTQGFFSAGSTGACLAAGTLVIGRIKGVSRPALAMPMPSPIRPTVLCDVGANADCKPEYLVQFAKMASVYADKIVGLHNPSVALLNIGSEETKGSVFAQTTHDLLKEQVEGFKGNAEGGDILSGKFDVIVTDGFTGNVCLKTIEGTSKVVFGSLKDIFKSSASSMLGALLIKTKLKALVEKISPDTYGGAPLLGVKGACIVGHGSSNPTAVKNGILTAARVVRSDVSGVIAQAVADEKRS